MKYTTLILMQLLWIVGAVAQNPIIPNKGANDPHIHIFNNKAYLYASHDKSIESKAFTMDDWWVWSSDDLTNWKYESTLKPEDTYLGKPYSRCWATDAAQRNGKTYFYFSEGNEQSGVVVGDTPIGPWKDPLGKPLLSKELTPTHEYDMAVFEDKGEHYILFGVWDYYIAKLNPDMISLAEEPKLVSISNPRGPYNQDGKNKEMPTDDKPFLHKYNGKYYLSWGCFYAMSDNIYGPYSYTDAIIDKYSFAPGYDAPTWPNGFLQGRHGSFFTWHNQWYFAYCDISQTGNRYFRDTFISYIHYKKNGQIARIRVDGLGVGNYDATLPKTEAEEYFKSEGFEKEELTDNQFVVRSIAKKASLNFQHFKNLSGYKTMEIHLSSDQKQKIKVSLKDISTPKSKEICQKYSIGSESLISLPISFTGKEANLQLTFEGMKSSPILVDYITFDK